MARIGGRRREHWTSGVGFVLAAAGSAIGLGNLWKFPYMAGASGGGAFVLAYFVILIIIGFTLMLAEISLGRYTQLNAFGAYRSISRRWSWVGALGVAAAFLILSYYSVIGGWIIHYLVQSATGALQAAGPAELEQVYNSFVAGPSLPVLYHALFMVATLLIVIGGIGSGIERASKIMMPALFILITALAVRSVTLEGASEGLRYLLVPDFAKLNIRVILNALGQVFFSLSLGIGVMITYGSYLERDTNIGRTAVIIPLLDTAVALLAGLVVLPAVFAFGLEPTTGPGLIFVTLPAVFAQMPLGVLFAFLFFLLVLFAALTSSISLLEVCVSYVVDEWGWSRSRATWILAVAIFAVGVPVALGFGPWSHITLLPGMDFFSSYDFVASTVVLPLAGLLLAIFVGWVWGTDSAIKEVTNQGQYRFALAPVWTFLLKYIAPVAIAIVFIRSVL